MNVVAKLASEMVRTDGWLLVFVFVPVTLVVMALSRTPYMNALTN